MNGAEGKADVQVTRLGHVFPFGGSSGSPLPNLTQCCRFSIPERLPLLPFRQDRLPRLPLPPSIMAATCKTVTPTGTGAFPAHGQYSDINPQKKVIQLEKNIVFLQESHVKMLACLHEEISDLKQKNRELQFQLVTGFPARQPELVIKEAISPDTENVEKLEKELRKLRIALKEALKNNTTLANELEILKREQYVASEHEGSSRGGRPRRPSPEMDEYGDTLKQIQRAAGTRNLKSSDVYHGEQSNHYWNKGGSAYMENRRGHNYHYPMMQRSHDTRRHYHQQQPRLPRLPLRNQLQNYLSHNQYEIQYQQHCTSSILPSLKQSDQNKPRKSRGPPPQAKVADKLYNQ